MRSKVVFSANTQETLGIGCYEGTLVGALPMVPDRLSYSEMYLNDFKYPSEWTESWESYLEHKEEVVEFINNLLNADPNAQMRRAGKYFKRRVPWWYCIV